MRIDNSGASQAPGSRVRGSPIALYDRMQLTRSCAGKVEATCANSFPNSSFFPISSRIMTDWSSVCLPTHYNMTVWLMRVWTGIRQENGAKIDTVTLPPWAHENPRLFVELHRKALESDYVSENLQKWIDLIFGFRQTGSEAVDAVNVFHHLSYDGAIGMRYIDQR